MNQGRKQTEIGNNDELQWHKAEMGCKEGMNKVQKSQ